MARLVGEFLPVLFWHSGWHVGSGEVKSVAQPQAGIDEISRRSALLRASLNPAQDGSSKPQAASSDLLSTLNDEW